MPDRDEATLRAGADAVGNFTEARGNLLPLTQDPHLPGSTVAEINLLLGHISREESEQQMAASAREQFLGRALGFDERAERGGDERTVFEAAVYSSALNSLLSANDRARQERAEMKAAEVLRQISKDAPTEETARFRAILLCVLKREQEADAAFESMQKVEGIKIVQLAEARYQARTLAMAGYRLRKVVPQI